METMLAGEQAPYQRDAREVMTALGSDPETGLSQAVAEERLAALGRNELTAEEPTPAWRRFFAQFWDPLVVLLLIATAISIALWLYERESALPYEAIAIFSVVLLNAAMGYVQESRAESAVTALKQMAAARARVVRDGALRNMDAALLVPGDIIAIEEGDTIPADARVTQSTSLKCAEAALTGESLPVAKSAAALSGETGIGDRTNMVFSGTAASYGHGRAVVVATGMDTEMGRIAGMLRDAPDEDTPLQKELSRVGKALGIVVIAIAAVMIGTIMIIEDVRGWSAVLEALIFGIALAVAAVPEGLPAVVTAVLSLGVQRMARRNAIVRHLSAVETLGSADVIASDKTGTLTRNEMTVTAAVTASGLVTFSGTGYAPEGQVRSEAGDPLDGPLAAELERALTIAGLANNAVLREESNRWGILGDPTEGALVVAARKAGLGAGLLQSRYPRVAEVPFSSERKLMSTVHTNTGEPGSLYLFVKGAPDVLLARCTQELAGSSPGELTDGRRAEILRRTEQLASQALRTLAVAYRTLPALPAEDVEEADANESLEYELTFAGLIGMIDPPRPEAREAVLRARAAGIRPIMITGDHPITAREIARELGISDGASATTGAELEQASDDELNQLTRKVSVYARVNPEHKLRIVRSLQQQGAIVAMTGDGVNDAPALKKADIGVAMGITGTDVSKQAADMILADDNFATIVSAVEEGRSIFANIRKFLRFLLSSNMGEVLTMFLGVLLEKAIGLEAENGHVVLPLLATQLLWINLVTDGAPALALGVDPVDRDVMSQPPRPTGEPVITRRMWAGIFSVALIMAAGTLGVLDASLPGGLIPGSGSMRYAQTMAFTTLMMFQLFNVFNARSDERSALEGLFSNLWLWGAIGLAIVLHCAVIYLPALQQAFSTTPLAPGDWLLCAAVASTVLWLRDIEKAVGRWNRSRGSKRQ